MFRGINNLNILIFSKNRPLQLDLCLNSFLDNSIDEKNNDITVLYKVDPEYKHAYKNLILEYEEIRFIEEEDFETDVLNIISEKPYVLFVTDDTIFIHHFYLDNIINFVEQNEIILGFSLRLGKNIKYCYSMDMPQSMPACLYFNDICVFNWTEGTYDFGYPLEVSSSLYRTDDILEILKNKKFKNPNILEATIDYNKIYYNRRKPFLACFVKSLAFSSPMNLTQCYNNNRNSRKEEFSPLRLLERYNNGFRIPLMTFMNFIPTSPHQEVNLLKYDI